MTYYFNITASKNDIFFLKIYVAHWKYGVRIIRIFHREFHREKRTALALGSKNILKL